MYPQCRCRKRSAANTRRSSPAKRATSIENGGSWNGAHAADGTSPTPTACPRDWAPSRAPKTAATSASSDRQAPNVHRHVTPRPWSTSAPTFICAILSTLCVQPRQGDTVLYRSLAITFFNRSSACWSLRFFFRGVASGKSMNRVEGSETARTVLDVSGSGLK